jgi:hypothetical protein
MRANSTCLCDNSEVLRTFRKNLAEALSFLSDIQKLA